MGKLTEPSTKLGMVDIPAVSKFVSDVANNRLSPCTTNDDERCESSNAHNVISIRTRLKTLASTDWTKAGMVEVKVGEIVALDHFYLLPDDAGQRQCLEAELGRFYEHLEGVGMVDESIGYYATKMKASNVWARVKIITWPEPKQEGHYFCQFLDYGLIDMIDGRALLPLDDRFKMAPPMAIKCALFDIKPLFGWWNKQMISLFKQIMSKSATNLKMFAIERQSLDVYSVFVIGPEDNINCQLGQHYVQHLLPH